MCIQSGWKLDKNKNLIWTLSLLYWYNTTRTVGCIKNVKLFKFTIAFFIVFLMLQWVPYHFHSIWEMAGCLQSNRTQVGFWIGNLKMARKIHGVTSRKIQGVTSRKIHGVTSRKIQGVTSRKIHGVTSRKIQGVFKLWQLRDNFSLVFDLWNYFQIVVCLCCDFNFTLVKWAFVYSSPPLILPCTL